MKLQYSIGWPLNFQDAYHPCYCHDTEWFHVFLKKLFFTKKIDFPKIRQNNHQYFILVLFWLLPVPMFFLAFSIPFSLLFYFHYQLHCMFFLAAVKNWVLIMGKA